ncbi:hypothetical protein [Bdellovibrio reynosensis]|uniref:Uncharacterized protein n=1 Tax=Bdellovibrio reynosensis TaxID=2835041 RepID=A0ABY4C764_9BACT|nr:hypothetical protein [Bdellovibrio reynosensis]UOF00770.1 hypothetical protein MNR06_13790 [Bdellovibrio reynosensis]
MKFLIAIISTLFFTQFASAQNPKLATPPQLTPEQRSQQLMQQHKMHMQNFQMHEQQMAEAKKRGELHHLRQELEKVNNEIKTPSVVRAKNSETLTKKKADLEKQISALEKELKRK